MVDSYRNTQVLAIDNERSIRMKFSAKLRLIGYNVLCLVVFAALVTSAVVTCRSASRKHESGHRSKRFQTVLAEGLTFNRHGVYGIDFLKVGSARIEKMRKGPFTLGAYNILVLDDLDVVIPSESQDAEQKLCSRGDMSGKGKADAAYFDFLPSSFSFLSASGQSFSSVKIFGVRVSRQCEQGVEPLFSARYGSTRKGVLMLEDCAILAHGASNMVHRAKICVRNGFPHLEWNGGSMSLKPFSEPSKKQHKENEI